ncbi:hypothetical protein SSX86_027507 [Deinandra increscens subsp. villosa]|uniref:DUF4283 domain-containing protein n=1 Tax=Deinandra increscens subsp. villosa TaxID=3103831 RepID=A0AAP0CBU3_9ASTR
MEVEQTLNRNDTVAAAGAQTAVPETGSDSTTPTAILADAGKLSSPDTSNCSINSNPGEPYSPIHPIAYDSPMTDTRAPIVSPAIPMVDPHIINYTLALNHTTTSGGAQNPSPETTPTTLPHTALTSNPHLANDPRTVVENIHSAHTNQPKHQTVTRNAWLSSGPGKSSFADKLKRSNAVEEVKIEYVPPVVAPRGNKRAVFATDDLKYTAQRCALMLYGYFLGTSVDFDVVNVNLKRLWRSYDIDQVTKTDAGLYYIKFKSEQGMNEVLENGPWMINNIPILLNRWEPGISLHKQEPSSIPIWVTVHNVPIELWSGKGISKLMSVIGYPLLMDKSTQERCLNQNGKLGYVRVLVEISAESELPTDVEIEFPSINNRPGRIAKLDVSYQWKPAACTFCKVFGHTTKLCKKRPLSDEEILAANEKEIVAKNKSQTTTKDSIDEEGFVTVGKKNRREPNNNQKVTNEAKGKSVASDNHAKPIEAQQIRSYQKLLTSSDPIVQQKMRELHEHHIESLKPKHHGNKSAPPEPKQKAPA